MACGHSGGEAGDLTTYECIYCLRRLDAQEFNREHVLSEAFGAFRQAPVLHCCICRKCNQFFGDQLEVRFARGAFEGMLRYQNGVRTPPEGAVNLRYVELAIPDRNDDWSGVRLRLMNGLDGLTVSLIPQAAFFDQSRKRWVHLTVDEIDAGLLTKRPDFKNGQIRIFARSSQEYETVVSRLGEHGVNFQKAGDLRSPEGLLEATEMEVEVTLTVNQGIRRCIAKYAFNYLALVCGSEFVRGPDFDITRRFIRYGGVPPYPLVVPSSKPILYDDRPSARRTDGHLLTLSWTASLDLVGQVSLFNHITYHVLLCRRYGGLLWRPVRRGIHYDLDRKIVKPLMGFSKDLVPS